MDGVSLAATQGRGWLAVVGSKSKGTLTRETETWCRRLVEERVVRRGREERREEKRRKKRRNQNNNKDSSRKRDEKRNEPSKRKICHVSNGIAR